MGFKMTSEVATWGCPSVSCEIGFPEAFAETAAEVAADDFGAVGFELEMPNWVEY